MDYKHTHDFDSILRFIENNFSLPYIDGNDNAYADYNAPDNQNGNAPLSDFFGNTFYSFTSITTYQPYTCFQSFANCTQTTYVPQGPDGND